MCTSRSDNTTGSKRCCNRTTCPFYMCSGHNSGTVFESAQDETSTQFLYFGQNFGGNPSGELQEFRDCQSENDGNGNGQKFQTRTNTVSATFESNNYGMILKQIICMSQKLLKQMEQKEQRNNMDIPPGGARGFGDNYMSVSQAQNMQQQQSLAPTFGGNTQRYNLNSVVPAAGAGNLPIRLGMLQIEPVHLTIPFTLNFQGVPAPGTAASPSGTSANMGPMRVCSITGPSMPQTMQPPVAAAAPLPVQTMPSYGNMPDMTAATSTSAVGQFPYTIGTQTDMYVSEGKFPPITVQKPPSVGQNAGYAGQGLPTTLQQNEDRFVDELCDFDMKSEGGENMPYDMADKAVQTEKRSSKKRSEAARNEENVVDGEDRHDGQDAQGTSEINAEIDSHRNNSYLEPATQEAALAESSEQQIPNEPLFSRTSLLDNLQHVSFSGKGEEDPGIKTEQLLCEELEQRRQSQLKEKQLQKLLEEQQLYEKPPPPLDLSENKSVSSKLPHNMSYPSQYGRADTCTATTSSVGSACPVCGRNQQQSEMDVPQMDVPVCCQCRCGLNKKKMLRSKKSKCGMSLARKSCSNICSKDLEKKKSSTRLGDDDYYSPLSDSEVEKKCSMKKVCSKKQVCKGSNDTRPVDAAIMQVLDRMMQVLDCMQTANRKATRSSSVRTRPSSQLGELEEGNDMYTSESIEVTKNMDRRFFTCLDNPECDGEYAEDKTDDDDDDERCNQMPMPKDELPDRTTDNMPCCVPYMMITFDPETGLPCCCLHSGALRSPCQEVPVINAQTCAGARRSLQNERTICQSEGYDDDEICGNILIQDEMEIINETHIRVVDTEECNELCEEDYAAGDIKGDSKLAQRNILITLCAETQTEECLGPFPASDVPATTDLLEELRAFRDELCESESCHYSDSKIKSSSKSRSGGDIRSECDCCHCRAERQGEKPTSSTVEDYKRELKALVDSVIMDLEAMELVRRQNISSLQCNEESNAPPKCAQKSFPVTITEVTELGKSSLYVKWAIHDCFGIGGYEIYVDGYLTNRYFNPRHEAAVVCEIDVNQTHKIALMAKPKAISGKPIMGAGDIYMEDDPTPTPAHWKPSIFLYEPNNSMDYCKVY